jgi:pyruvate/2-oxoglutarate dehydrogenase complex dihydrolipoamide dehydrogenase (E3) component
MQLNNCALYRGHARFESPREVSVGTTLLTAERIFINVGTRPRIPALPGIHQIDYLTNSTMMDIDFLPAHLMIVGGGYIGLEFGHNGCD